MNNVAVGIGSNINPHENIQKVLHILSNEHTVIKISSIVQTKPIGYTDQPDFLNASILLATTHTMEEFSLYLKDVERRLGRVKSINKNGPRTIDLDIVVWNNMIVDNDFYKRDFLKKSILEILPFLIYH